MDQQAVDDARNAAIRGFVRSTFGLHGTLRLHRSAFGNDLLRAPANVFLAPIFLFTRLIALTARGLGFHRFSAWMSDQKFLLETKVSRQVAAQTMTLVADLEAKGLGAYPSRTKVASEIANYAGVRNAVSEITTTLMVVLLGYVAFQSATPGVISLAGPVTELRAHISAVEQFPLGQGLGRLYYGVFSNEPAIWQFVATGAVLAVLASLVTTFAGVVVDPLQVITGTHRRRLSRLLRRLETDQRQGSGLAGEHITARMADLSDMALNAWRAMRN